MKARVKASRWLYNAKYSRVRRRIKRIKNKQERQLAKKEIMEVLYEKEG